MPNPPTQLSIEGALAAESASGGSSLSAVISADEGDSGRYTAARLRRERPEVATAIQALLEAGYGAQEVADRLHVHFYTVQCVAADCPEAVAVGKKHTARLAGNVGRSALEKIKEFVDSNTIKSWTDAQRAAMIAGITIDKAQVLDGEPTAIVKTDAPSITSVGEFMSQLLPAQPVPASENSDAKRTEEDIVVAAGGALVGAYRRVTERQEAAREARVVSGYVAPKADSKAECATESLMDTCVASEKQLILNQSAAQKADAIEDAVSGADGGSVERATG